MNSKLKFPIQEIIPDSPGIGVGYIMTNISKSFINLNLNYYNALGRRTYGFAIQRELISSRNKIRRWYRHQADVHY